VSTPSDARLRAFVRGSTRVREIEDTGGVRLHVAEDVMELCRATGLLLDEPDPFLPFWAFPWVGGLGVTRYLLDQPELVEGRSVLDIGTGSGLCAIVAARLGASEVVAVDVDPLATAAVELNARLNGVRPTIVHRDILGDPPPAVDLVLAGDIAYEGLMASRMEAWLRHAARLGARVLIGDPGRRHLPPALERLATYEVSASLEIEDRVRKRVDVYTIDEPAG
jgi:predicted nicotinamide N-methyase